MSAMINLEVPWINIMSKMDLVTQSNEDSSSGRNGVKRRRSQREYSLGCIFASSPLNVPFQDKETVPQIQPLTLHLVSRKSGKPSLAGVANHYLQQGRLGSTKGVKYVPEIFVRDITEHLEGKPSRFFRMCKHQ